MNMISLRWLRLALLMVLLACAGEPASPPEPFASAPQLARSGDDQTQERRPDADDDGDDDDDDDDGDGRDGDRDRDGDDDDDDDDDRAGDGRRIDVFDTVDLEPVAVFKTAPGPDAKRIVVQKIGSAGGSLRLGDFEVVVPAGAVDRTTTFYIRLPNNAKQASRAMAEFGPHRRFNRPVTVRLPAAATTVTGMPSAMWWSGRRWVPLETTSTGDGRIETKVNHFSVYGSSSNSRGVTTLGG